MSEAQPVPDWLYGRWRFRDADADVGILPDTCMDFRTSGQLLYTVLVEGQQAQFDLQYQVRGNLLQTLNPDGGQTSSVAFERIGDDLLQLDFNGKRARFVRERLM